MRNTRIEKVEVIPIRAPRKEVVRSGLNPGDPVSASEFGVVRIETAAGIEGLGEISITFPRLGHPLCRFASARIAPELIGEDALAAGRVLARADRLLEGVEGGCYLRAAIAMALLDTAGKCYSIPAWQMLGGRVRERIPLAWGIYQKAPEEMAEDAAWAVREGYSAIKLKVGRRLEDDLNAVRAVAQAAGDLPFRLDANGAWRSAEEALQAIHAFTEVARVEWVEQPVPRNLDLLRRVREESPVPVMADESCRSLRDAFDLAAARAADVFNIYVAEAGGPREAAAIFGFAGSLGIPCILGSQAEMGIGTAACAHLGVSLPDLPHAFETFGPLRYVKDIVAAPVRIEGGYLWPPEGPGLGVELDWDVISEYRG
ncbi:MAG: hypothetical protein IT167_14490 [Bryobacterales bacterium]|nr:hypothetical protein [Bryobacterales bacterium]